MAALSSEKFLERLTRGKCGAVVLLLGSEVYLRDICRAQLVEAYVPEEARAWGVRRFSAAEEPLEAVLGQAQTLPMLTPRQVIFVEDVEALEKLGEEAREEVLGRLEAYLDDPVPSTVLVLEAAALDQRMRLFKLLSEKAVVVSVELRGQPKDRLAAAVRIAGQMARELGVDLAPDAAEELADSLDADLARIRTELGKLACYAGERQRITREDVEALVVAAKKYSVWQLAEVLADGNRAAALGFLESLLREGESPPALVGAVAWMYRKLLEAQELPRNLSRWQAAGQLGMRPETAELALRQSRNFARRQLLDGLKALYEADSRLKSSSTDPRAVLEFLVAQLAARAATATEAG